MATSRDRAAPKSNLDKRNLESSVAVIADVRIVSIGTIATSAITIIDIDANVTAWLREIQVEARKTA
jgi:hypothetical protein